MLPGLKQWFLVRGAYQNFLGELKKKYTIKTNNISEKHCFKSSQVISMCGHVEKLFG